MIKRSSGPVLGKWAVMQQQDSLSALALPYMRGTAAVSHIG